MNTRKYPYTVRKTVDNGSYCTNMCNAYEAQEFKKDGYRVYASVEV